MTITTTINHNPILHNVYPAVEPQNAALLASQGEEVDKKTGERTAHYVHLTGDPAHETTVALRTVDQIRDGYPINRVSSTRTGNVVALDSVSGVKTYRGMSCGINVNIPTDVEVSDDDVRAFVLANVTTMFPVDAATGDPLTTTVLSKLRYGVAKAL